MARKKFDVVIEAVRYGAEGQLSLARVYERRGPTFSDILLLSRAELVERLRQKQRVVIGRRIPYLASTFETGESVRLAGQPGREAVVCGSASGAGDSLPGAPVI